MNWGSAEPGYSGAGTCLPLSLESRFQEDGDSLDRVFQLFSSGQAGGSGPGRDGAGSLGCPTGSPVVFAASRIIAFPL